MLSNQIRQLEEENQRLKRKLAFIEGREDIDKKEMCRNCEFFVQHYVSTGTGYMATACGHCVQGKRVKDRSPENVCQYFKLGAFEKFL